MLRKPTKYVTKKKVVNDRYIRIKHKNHKKEFNEEAQKGCIQVIFNASYAYIQNQDVAAAAWIMKTRSR